MMKRKIKILIWFDLIHKIKDDSKINREKNIDRHSQRHIVNVWHLSDPPSFSLPTTFKGSPQWESTGVRKVPICPNLARTAAIEVRFSINFAVVFNFTYFRFCPSNAKWISDVLPNRRNATIRSMFFSFFIMRIAYWRTESVCVLRQCAANCKKSPRNKIWKL